MQNNMKLFPARLKPRLLILITAIIIVLVAGGFSVKRIASTSDTIKSETPIENATTYNDIINDTNPEYEGIIPSEEKIALNSAATEKQALLNAKEPKNPSDTSNVYNILVLGIDRRHGDQKNWRTDVIQLITLSPKRDNVVITHLPRDIWSGSYKINAIYNLQGPDAIKDAVEEITGQRPDRIVRVDFDAFVWAIDSVGGLSINVPKGFVDEGYPQDREGKDTVTTVEFKAGEQIMDGETALIYTRSRKGSNGEGSDYARGRRQQLVMQSIVDDFFQPDNLFKPKTAETLYNLATKKIYTDITLSDTKVLFEIFKNYKNIRVENISLDTNNYLTVPADKSAYGGAWVLVAKENSYKPVQEKIINLIEGSSINP
jgi:LCP family protein required for cell wall assembly